MKNLTFFIALLFSISLTAQDSPGKSPKLLLGRKVKVKDNSDYKNNGYADFYLDKELNKKYACCQKANSKYEELANKTFKVEDVTPNSDNTFCLKLKSGSQTVYYKYDAVYESRFPFTVEGGLKIEEGAYVDMIHEDDNSDGQGGTTFRSESLEGIRFAKSNYDGVENYSVIISTEQILPGENVKGVNLYLENSITIKKPETTVKVTQQENGRYLYSSILILKSEEVSLLKMNKITGVSQGGLKTELKEGAALKSIFRSFTPLTPKKGELKKDICDLVYESDHDGKDIYVVTSVGKALSVSKIVSREDKSVKYQARVSITGNKLQENLTTATLFFINAKQVIRDNVEISVKPLENGMYEYSTTFYLTADEVILLCNANVYKVMLDTIFSSNINESDLFKGMFNCLIMKGPEKYPSSYNSDSNVKDAACDYIAKLKRSEGTEDNYDTFLTDERDGITLGKDYDPDRSSDYFLSLKVAMGEDKTIAKTTLSLANGEQITRLAEKSGKTGYDKSKKIYSAIISLTGNEVNLLKKHAIVSISLDKHTVKVKKGSFIKDMFNCLTLK